MPIPIGSWSAGGLTPGRADVYEIQPTANGLLTAQAHAESTSLQIRLSLFDGVGNLLVQSDGVSAGQPDPLINQHLTSGFAYVEVQDLSGSGTFEVGTTLQPSSDPGQTLALPPEFQEWNYAPIAVGDFTNDGIPDILATAGVHPGIGDGTFGAPPPTGALVDPTQFTDASAIAVGDFNGDHNLDAAVALAGTDSVSISLGNGDGTFEPATTIPLPASGTPSAIVAGDFGTGHVDLAVADSTLGVVYILQGNGDGTFSLSSTIPVGQGPDAIAEGDFTGDGRTDLAVADSISGDVTVLMNDGDGTFTALPPIGLRPGTAPSAIVAGDFGTGNLDLAVVDSTINVVDVLAGNGDGTFRPDGTATVGGDPFAIVAGDFTGNGRTDLALANAYTNNVSVLLGNGDGTFQPALYTAAGSSPLSIAAGDFNGDGRLDLATENAGSNDISVLLSKGDGTFGDSVANRVGDATAALATGDFTGNGNLGLAVANQGSSDITILPGNGDGTFQHPITIPLPQGSGPTRIVAVDFNDDGRTDLAVADPVNREVDILLGNGDGTFQAFSPIPVTGAPVAIAAGDFDGNGLIDLAVADRYYNTVTILLNNGDASFHLNNGHGTFRALSPIVLGEPNNPPFPDAIVVGQFVEGDPVDLAVAEPGTDSVAILVGNGDGTFQVAPPISLGGGVPYTLSVLAGDFTNDGRTDLVVASTDFSIGDSIDMLQGVGNGNFVTLAPISLDFAIVLPAAVVAVDFNHDGNLDLATADANGSGTDDYSVYLGNGDGTFSGPTHYALGGLGVSTAIAVGDFANDGRISLAIARTGPDDVDVRLNNGDGTFSGPAVTDLVRRQTPVVGDLNGDGTPDVSVVDAAGDIRFRAGAPGAPGSFAPPITVNPGHPSRDIAFVQTGLGPRIASADANDGALSFFGWGASGFTRVASLSTGFQPAQVVASDLDGTSQADLIVRNAGDGTLSVYMADGHGWFLSPEVLPVGLGASDIQVANFQGDGRLDIVVTDRLSGEVELLRNLGNGAFAAPVVEQAGRGPYGSTGSADPTAVTSLEGTSSVTSGVFTPGGLPSLVALDPGSDDFGLLSGLGDGRLSNAAIFPTPSDPLVVRAVDFNGDGLDGLAILTAGGLYIERPDGHGGFLPPTEIDVGFEPNGLTVADLNGDGKADLLVSNPRGDLLVLLGQGDGTFQAPRKVTGPPVSLAADFGADGSTEIITADQQTDQVIVRTASGGVTVLADKSTGLVSPGAVKLADLNGDGIPDLIVADSGSNDVLVYSGLSDGTFSPALNDGRGIFTGTHPVGITVADIAGNGIPDLIVANEGSNTISVLFNTSRGGNISFKQGPVLSAGLEPVSTVVGDFNGDGIPDLLVTDSQSNEVRLLPGIAGGFFNDQNPTINKSGIAPASGPVIFPVGDTPVASFVGKFDGRTDLVTVDSGSNALTLISGFEGPDPVTSTIDSGGLQPATAFAFSSGGGFENLVVGNAADGRMVLFEGGLDGLTQTSAASDPNVPNPTALAFSALVGGQVQFYAVTAGGKSPELVALSLSVPIERETDLVEESPSSPTGSVQLVVLHETSLPLVATVLTLTIPVSGEEPGAVPAESEALGVVATVAGAGTSAGQGPITTARGVGATTGETEESDESGPPTAAMPAVLAAWERFVLGLDAALEELDREGTGGIPGPSGPPDPPPGPGAPAPSSGSGLRLVPARPSGAERDGRDVPDPATRTSAIDAAVSWLDRSAPGRLPVGGRSLLRQQAVWRGRFRPALLGRKPDTLRTGRASEPEEVEPTALGPGKDESGLAAACLTLSLLATRGLPDRPVRFSIRRRNHVLI